MTQAGGLVYVPTRLRLSNYLSQRDASNEKL
jgi:hypothetical protein